MSYNDRIRECAQWVRAHRGDTVEVPKDALADMLWEGADGCTVPWQLGDWIRDTARLTADWSTECMDASVPPEAWWRWGDEAASYGEDWADQPSHADCPGVGRYQLPEPRPCTCPCHQPDPAETRCTAATFDEDGEAVQCGLLSGHTDPHEALDGTTWTDGYGNAVSPAVGLWKDLGDWAASNAQKPRCLCGCEGTPEECAAIRGEQ